MNKPRSSYSNRLKILYLSQVVMEMSHDYGTIYITGDGLLQCWPIEYSPDGSMLAFGYGNVTGVFNVSSGNLETVLDEPGGTNRAGYLDWSRDGWLAKSDQRDTLLYDSSTWEVVTRFSEITGDDYTHRMTWKQIARELRVSHTTRFNWRRIKHRHTSSEVGTL